jgi:hypothetical protein
MARYKKYLSFRAYKKAVRALGITSVAELKNRQGEIPRAPSNPNIIYQNDGWKGHADLFGKNGVRGGKSNQRHRESLNGHASSELRAWSNMMSRCLNCSAPRFKYYGALGVFVCERWKTFANFLSDLGRKPSGQHSLGRVGDVGNYEPENARWMSPKEQSAEKRKKYATRHFISKYRPTPQLRTPDQLPLAA